MVEIKFSNNTLNFGLRHGGSQSFFGGYRSSHSFVSSQCKTGFLEVSHRQLTHQRSTKYVVYIEVRQHTRVCRLLKTYKILLLYRAHFAPHVRLAAVFFQDRARFPMIPRARAHIAQRHVRQYFRPVMRMALAALFFARKAANT